MDRRVTPELMDSPDADPAELRRSLGYIRWVNRRLGGRWAMRTALLAWSRSWPKDRPVTLLDIATGSADLPVYAVRWARARGFDLRVTAVDNHAVTLEAAREYVDRFSEERGAIELVECDAFGLVDRYGAESFDHVHAGLFLHHLPSELRVMTMLRMMERLGRAGTAWNDLVRSRVAHRAIRLLTIGKPRMVRHDARVSVEGAFTRREAISVGVRSDWNKPVYRFHPIAQRFVLYTDLPIAWRRS